MKDICNDLDVRRLCHKILQNVGLLTNADRYGELACACVRFCLFHTPRKYGAGCREEKEGGHTHT